MRPRINRDKGSIPNRNKDMGPIPHTNKVKGPIWSIASPDGLTEEQ